MGNRSSRTRNRSSRTLKGHSDYVRSVSFSPDGASIVSGSRDNTVKVWSVESGECVTTFEGHSGMCIPCRFPRMVRRLCLVRAIRR